MSRVHDLQVYLSRVLKSLKDPSRNRGAISYGIRNSRTKEMLSATRDGAPVFAKETENSGVHDARIMILARVRPNNKQKNCTHVVVASTSIV